MNTHKAISLIGGDDLFINVQLTDQDRQPYVIDTLDYVRWLLHNAKGEIVPIDSFIQTIDAATGKIRIWLPHTETTKLAGGIYTEWLRISCNNTVSTLLTGPLNVTADPWRAPIGATLFVSPLSARSTATDIVIQLDPKERIKRRPATAEERELGKILPWQHKVSA